MRTTFLNDNNENNLKEIGLKALESRAEDFQYFETFNNCEDEQDFIDTLKDQDFDVDEIMSACEKFKDISEFHNYGLCFDFVACNNEEQTEAYFRYQLSYGGPSEEIRFYEDGTIEFVYLDWFCGVGFDVSNDDRFNWLEDHFKDCEMIDFESQDYEDRFLMKDIED